MKYLIDTAVFLWMALQPEKLSKTVSKIVEDGENTICLSAASTWEIAIKYSLGKLELRSEPADFMREAITKMNVDLLPIAHHHALSIAKLPFHHKDPFDRLLIAQAQTEKLPIITLDKHFTSYDVDVIW